MTRTTVYLEDETMHGIRRIANSKKRPQSEIIRDALEQYVREEEKDIPRRLPPGAGKYRSGQSDISKRAREILLEAARKRR